AGPVPNQLNEIVIHALRVHGTDFRNLAALAESKSRKRPDSNVAIKLPLFLLRQVPLLVLSGQLVHLFPVFFGKAQVEQGSRGLSRQGELASLDYSGKDGCFAARRRLGLWHCPSSFGFSVHDSIG